MIAEGSTGRRNAFAGTAGKLPDVTHQLKPFGAVHNGMQLIKSPDKQIGGEFVTLQQVERVYPGRLAQKREG